MVAVREPLKSELSIHLVYVKCLLEKFTTKTSPGEWQNKASSFYSAVAYQEKRDTRANMEQNKGLYVLHNIQ